MYCVFAFIDGFAKKIKGLLFFCYSYNIVWSLPLPRTPVMYAIISLHDHILFLMCIILTFVSFLLLTTIISFKYSHNSNLEINNLENDNLFDIDTKKEKVISMDSISKYLEKVNIKGLNMDFINKYLEKVNIRGLNMDFINKYLEKVNIRGLNMDFINKYLEKVNIRGLNMDFINKYLEKINIKGINNQTIIKNYKWARIDFINWNKTNFKKMAWLNEIIWSQKLNTWLNIAHFTRLEIYWTLLPCFLLILIAVPSFWLLYTFDEIMDPTITFKIIGHQWYWSYELSDFFNLSNKLISNDSILKYDSYLIDSSDLKKGELRLLKTTIPLIIPKDLHIRFLITSEDVLHSFAVPSFGIKVDAVPGRLNQASVFVKDLGVYFGQCSELCGANHGFMPIEIMVFPVKHFYNLLQVGNLEILKNLPDIQ